MKRHLITLILICAASFAAAAQEPPPPTDTPVKITGQTQPKYTEEARQAAAQGEVLLNIVFQEDGKIGEITLAKKIIESRYSNNDTEDYGLVGKAIEAAKQLKFIPASANGEPVTVTKKVNYTFELYTGSYRRKPQ